METHDFSNAKVGDKVSHPVFGNGVIKINDHSHLPIQVVFDQGHFGWFYSDGRYTINDVLPTLYYGLNTFQIIATPVSPYKVGEWIAVLHGEDWKFAQYIGMDNSGWATVRFNGDDETMPPCNYKYHKSLIELNAELNNK